MSFVTGGNRGKQWISLEVNVIEIVEKLSRRQERNFSHLHYLNVVCFFLCYSFKSRLLVRLAGLWTLAATAIFMAKMVQVTPGPFKHHELRYMEKNAHRAYKIVKELGQGGPMKYFLNFIHPVTRSLRIIVGAWRWIESAQCRRGEVGTEEAMVRVRRRKTKLLQPFSFTCYEGLLI